MREIEVKMRLDNRPAFEAALASRGVKLGGSVGQHDTIYVHRDEPIERQGTEGHIALRLRREGDRTIFTCKKQCSNESDKIEHETVVESREEMDKILRELGWIVFVEVKKERHKGKVGEYEVCLDEVAGLGSFAELEKNFADDANHVAIQKELLDIMEELGVPRENRQHFGYDRLMLRKNSKD